MDDACERGWFGPARSPRSSSSRRPHSSTESWLERLGRAGLRRGRHRRRVHQGRGREDRPARPQAAGALRGRAPDGRQRAQRRPGRAARPVRERVLAAHALGGHRHGRLPPRARVRERAGRAGHLGRPEEPRRGGGHREPRAARGRRRARRRRRRPRRRRRRAAAPGRRRLQGHDAHRRRQRRPVDRHLPRQRRCARRGLRELRGVLGEFEAMVRGGRPRRDPPLARVRGRRPPLAAAAVGARHRPRCASSRSRCSTGRAWSPRSPAR